MRREAPDTRFFFEIKDFNMEFLTLLAAAPDHGPQGLFGLDGAIVSQVARMTPGQLETMADVPCLLAGFGTRRSREPAGVAEPSPAMQAAAWAGHARLFAAELLTYTWQMARRDPLRAALCLGADALPLVDKASVRDIHVYANRALQHLQARFLGHWRFWPDLVCATREGRTERIQLARLTAIQAATLEARRRPLAKDSARKPAVRSAAAR